MEHERAVRFYQGDVRGTEGALRERWHWYGGTVVSLISSGEQLHEPQQDSSIAYITTQI